MRRAPRPLTMITAVSLLLATSACKTTDQTNKAAPDDQVTQREVRDAAADMGQGGDDAAADAGRDDAGGDTRGGDTGDGDASGVDLSEACPPSSPKQVAYRDVFDGELPARLADRMCIADPREALSGEMSCAEKFNASSIEDALEARQLEEVDVELQRRMGGRGGRGPIPGEVVEVGDGTFEVVLSSTSPSCGPRRPLTVARRGALIAKDSSGELVLVRLSPRVEVRDYEACGCFPGCGVEPLADLRVVVLDRRPTREVTLEYEALELFSTLIDVETCCCAP